MLSKKQLEDAARCSELKCHVCKANPHKGDCSAPIAQTALAYLAMLERLEWIDGHWCPICDGKDSHKPDCELAALLKEGLE